jgi:hypothetical protein
MGLRVTKKRLLLLLLVVVVGLGGFVGYTLWFGPGSQITMASCKKIVPGMKLDQVVDILGPPGDIAIFRTNSQKAIGLYFRLTPVQGPEEKLLTWNSNTGAIYVIITSRGVDTAEFVPQTPDYLGTLKYWLRLD